MLRLPFSRAMCVHAHLFSPQTDCYKMMINIVMITAYQVTWHMLIYSVNIIFCLHKLRGKDGRMGTGKIKIPVD